MLCLYNKQKVKQNAKTIKRIDNYSSFHDMTFWNSSIFLRRHDFGRDCLIS